jgi:transcriptional regulator with GAF, ATPase, and Fis domain
MAEDVGAIELASAFSEVARSLTSEGDVDSTLDRICSLAVQTIEGCESADISLATRSGVTSRRRTGEVPQIIDQIQSETQEGPCVDAIVHHEVFVTGDLPGESRWPAFARQAHEAAGVTSILSFRLYLEEDTLGALNLYSSMADAFDAHAVEVGLVYATHASVAMATARHEAQMDEALRGRDVIGQAKGILMSLRGFTEAEAIDALTAASQHLNVKLRVIADQVAFTGDLPDDHQPQPPG